MAFLIDTSIWVDVERGALSPGDVASLTGSEPVYLSPVTIAELKFGAERAQNPAVRQRRLAALERLKKKPLLRIDEVTGDIFGTIAAVLAGARRGPSFRVQALWLASQALQHGLKLLTRNVKDFADIPGLELMRVPEN